MACYETRTVVNLADREAITLPDVRGATLRVLRGMLWLTEERQRSDVLLRAGDNFVVEFNGDTVVEAKSDTRFTIVGRAGKELQLPRCGAPVTQLGSRLRALLALPRHAPYY
jgi:DUF2917 family protein